jgi:hypothetical protein
MQIILERSLFRSVAGGETEDSEVPSESGATAVVYIGPPPNEEQAAMDGIFGATVGRAVGLATTAFIDGMVVGAEVGVAGGPAGVIGGLVVGGAAGLLAWWILRPNKKR